MRTAEVILHLVRPQPPCTQFECVLAHVILEQGNPRDHTIGLISVHASDDHGSSIEHRAYSLPLLMNVPYVLRLAGLHVVCETRHCSVRCGAVPFAFIDWEEVLHRATSLTIRMRPRGLLLVPDSEGDHANLMQHSLPLRHSPPADAIDMPETASHCEGFRFNPHAAPFQPNVIPLGQMSDFVRDLHAATADQTFSWQGESSSFAVYSWFVDHYHQHLHH